MKSKAKFGIRIVTLILLGCIILGAAAGYYIHKKSADHPIPIKVLLLPKFEIGAMTGDAPGEAQFYYDAYLHDADSYVIPNGLSNSRLYVKDGVALYVTGMGKVNAALSTAAVLTDRRFDFSDAYIMSVGCCGSSRDTTVMGDVFVISAVADYDLGHHADTREMENPDSVTWFHDDLYDGSAIVTLNTALTDQVFELVRDVKLETTDATRRHMLETFDNAEWAGRDPAVLRGTSVCGDNYWKGTFDHENALKIVRTYGCADPFTAAEMEDIAVANAAKRLGMLDRLIILRVSVNMDVFMLGDSPERLWSPEDNGLEDPNNLEYKDIFPVSMENNFNVGKVIIEAILNGTLTATRTGSLLSPNRHV